MPKTPILKPDAETRRPEDAETNPDTETRRGGDAENTSQAKVVIMTSQPVPAVPAQEHDIMKIRRVQL